MQKAVKKSGILFIINLLVSFFSFSQNFDSTLYKYATDFAQERTYLHYDKSSYAPGDTIWFKAYLMEGISPAFDSKTLYVDWTDTKGNLLYHTLSPLQNAVTNGQFNIPSKYTGEFIHVKAYTKWMLNFDSSFIYEKDIRIITPPSGNANSVYKIKPELSFFPEGGDIVQGIVNKVAFKANDQWGRPVKFSGAIFNKKGTFIDSLRNIHDGMGYIFLLPENEENYTARWKDESGKMFTSALPEVKTHGLGLQVLLLDNKRLFVVDADSLTKAGSGNIYVVGTMNQHLLFKVTKNFAEGKIQGVIPVNNLPSGVLTITVFDKDWIPRAERITFIHNEDFQFQAEMDVQHWGLNKRARNEIEIAVPDSLYASLSVAVTDADIETDSTNNIISHFLLTSELKGRVFNPAYYFSANNNKVAGDLDLVMLTNGWRRFNWDDVVQGKMPKIKLPRDTAYLAISGKVYGVTPSELRDNPNITLVVSQKSGGQKNNIFQLAVAPDGTFYDPAAVIFDSANVYYQLSKSIRNASVQFMENILPAGRFRIPASGLFYNQALDTTGFSRHLRLADELAKIMEQYEGKILETVTLKAKTKSPIELLDEKYTSGLFSGGDNYQFDLVNDKLALMSTSIFQYLQGKVAGLQITVGSQSPTLQWRGGAPQLYLDETPVDANMLSNISINEVAYIKVMRPPFMGGVGGGSNGAIAVYTRKGGDVIQEPGKGLFNSKINGYSPVRQFYSPNYSSFSPTDELKDLRTTLYWNPAVNISPEQKKVVLTFYNNDVSRSFRVIIEGMSMDGRLFHMQQLME